MKETLLKVNVVLYTILYNVSLVYAGYVYGRHGRILFVFVLFYFLMRFIAVGQRNSPVIGTVKNYCIMAAVMLGFVCVFWGGKLQDYFESGMFPETELDYFIYPGILFLGSVLIAVNYFRCAAITRREDKKLYGNMDKC